MKFDAAHIPILEAPPKKSVEDLQVEFIEAVKTLQQIHNELTTAQWLREYDQAKPATA